MENIQISDDVRKALDRIDWSQLEVSREIVEANPKVAEQLAAGKATDLISYNVEIPGIPEPVEKKVQLVPRRMKDEATGEWVLDPKVAVRTMDEDYKLRRDNLKVVFGNGFSVPLDPEEHKEIISALLETRTYVNKETGEVSKQHVCNICEKPLTITFKDGTSRDFFIGLDSRSLRPVPIAADVLKNRFLDEEGHSKINHELFGKGIAVNDSMAKALAEGKICAAFGKGTKTGEPFATAISFNVSRDEIQEDHSAKGQEIRNAAYEYLKKTTPKAEKQEEAKKEQQAKTQAQGKKHAPKL